MRQVAFIGVVAIGSACAPIETGEKRGRNGSSGDARPKFSDDSYLCEPPAAQPALWLDLTPGYAGDIETLFQAKCVSCHATNGAFAPALDSYELVKAGAADSDEQIRMGLMPPGGLPQVDRDRFSAWVAAGMPPTAPAAGEGDEGGGDATAAGDGGSGAPQARCAPRGSANGQAGGGAADGSSADADADGGEDAGDAGDDADGTTGGEGEEAGAAADDGMAEAGGEGAGEGDGAADGAGDGVTYVTYLVDIKPLIDARCVSCHGQGGTPPNLTTYNGVMNAGARNATRINNNTMPPGNPLQQAQKDLYKAWVDGGYLQQAPAN